MRLPAIIFMLSLMALAAGCVTTAMPLPAAQESTAPRGASYDQVSGAYCREAIRAYTVRNGNR